MKKGLFNWLFDYWWGKIGVLVFPAGLSVIFLIWGILHLVSKKNDRNNFKELILVK